MAPNNAVNTASLKLRILKRVIIGSLVILAGVMGMVSLASLREPPAEAHNGERPLFVEVVPAEPEDVQVHITGYGEAKALDVVSISPEVPGKVSQLHPRLEVGESIGKSELLFRIDPSSYAAAHDETEAMATQWDNAIARLRKQETIDIERSKTIERNRNLAQAEYDRIRTLFEKDSVGTRSGVDRAEQAYNSSSDRADQMAQAVSLYPIRIKEAESSLASARARLTLAKVNLDRCEVRAPFDGRVKQVSLEKGQYISPGQPVLTLADDSMLEIRVPLDSRDVRKWLRFKNPEERDRAAWFSGLEPVPVRVHWTEMKDGPGWEGMLHRVVRFDSQTRMVTVAIRVEAQSAWSEDPGALPLVEGMFCSVNMPGRVMRNVVPLPRWAVTFENTVYVAEDNRLRTMPVTVDRSEGDITYVSEGLDPGDLVIATRLVDPLENSLLETSSAETDKSES